MNKYFEIVPISEKPEKDGWYYVLNPNREILPRMIEYKVGRFHNHNKVLASFYLKPIDALPIDRDKAAIIFDDAAAIDSKCVKPEGDCGYDSVQYQQLKEEYLKQFEIKQQ
jgi:hypothetical protein